VFDWVEYLDLAERLRSDATTGEFEARLRTAISRAYYAAFHHLRLLIYESDPAPKLTGIHDRLIQATFGDGVREDVRLVGVAVEFLKKARVDADYANPLKGNLSSMAEAACAAARDVVEEIRRIRSNAPLAADERQALQEPVIS
jgi:uncharacterized protein (UPF0332 family)